MKNQCLLINCTYHSKTKLCLNLIIDEWFDSNLIPYKEKHITPEYYDRNNKYIIGLK